MRVLMLGWEFPPRFSGGLGTACEGLTRALAHQGVEVLFALPTPLESPAALQAGPLTATVDAAKGGSFPGVEFRTIPALSGVSPYDRPATRLSSPKSAPPLTELGRRRAGQTGNVEAAELMFAHLHAAPADVEQLENADDADAAAGGSGGSGGAEGSEGLVGEAQRYADWCAALLGSEEVDVVHAHDWMTFPAGVALARKLRRPLVVHVHSTEFDRAGERADHRIIDIERQGMLEALTVICVSHLTRHTCETRYDIPAGKIQVVYNGINPRPRNKENRAASRPTRIEHDDKVVLFLGRITVQKGPEYFVEAAARVIRKVQKVKFVIAGAGDMTEQVIQLATEAGLADKVVFTGFLDRGDVERVFDMADVYVMPSVSEPFGIAPLEAIRQDVPVIISRTSGVAEVVNHVLKVDFWDTEDIAEKIIAVLRHPPLGRTLREHAEVEVRQLTWEAAASRCFEIYQRAMAGSGRTV